MVLIKYSPNCVTLKLYFKFEISLSIFEIDNFGKLSLPASKDSVSKIANKLGYVMAGGDLSEPTKVSEQYLLDIERENFMALLGNQKTLDRIQYLLMNNKPLRN